MPIDSNLLEQILPRVQTPGQYIGKEINSIVKNHSGVEFTIALCYPDSYAVGMSHLGLRILYDILNARADTACERAFAPWFDMADEMRKNNLPLFSLESRTPLKDFDMVGFSLQYEMIYTNILSMLDLSGIPLRSTARGEDDPLIIAGGPGVYNPEPLADFFDLFLIGDGEESVGQLVDEYKKVNDVPRREKLLHLARTLPFCYVPQFYDVSYNDSGTIKAIEPNVAGVPEMIERAWVKDLDSAPYPEKFVVPYVETVHDRLMLEIMRGCTHGCRFCQAGAIYRPRRYRSVEKLLALAEAGYKATGHEEIALLSLSSSDHKDILEIINRINAKFAPLCVNLSLPSLRVGDVLRLLPSQVGSVRKAGLTLAPEAASERLRHVINKGISNDELYAGAKAAYQNGWRLIKLYFMLGLPTETDADLQNIPLIAENVARLRNEVARGNGNVNLSVSTFVPKAHTPFQWSPMISVEETWRRQKLIKENLRLRAVNLKLHSANLSAMEGVMARGDRRLGDVIETAWRNGAQFDGWREHFRKDVWDAAFVECKIDPAFYSLRERSLEEVLPWSHINCGISQDFIKHEYARALKEMLTPNCQDGECQGCGLQNKGCSP